MNLKNNMVKLLCPRHADRSGRAAYMSQPSLIILLSRVSSSLYQFQLTFLSVLVRSVTQFLDRCSVDQVLMSFSLTFTMRSLKLIVFVTDSFATFGYNGIVRTKDVMPYSLFGDF